MKRIALPFVLALAPCASQAALPPIDIANQIAQAVRIESPSIKPVIDGTMDDVWLDAPEYTISSYVPNGTAFTPPDGPEDISGKWRALWDATNLYIYLEVIDDALVLAPMNDFELYLSTSYSRSYGFYEPYDLNDAQILWDLGNQPIVAKAGLYSVSSQANFPGTVTAVKETSTGYVAEVSITWASLNQNPDEGVAWDSDSGMFLGGPSEYEERSFIGFEIMLQDDDDGGSSDTKVAWYGGPPDRHGDYAWEDTAVWGTLELAKTPVCCIPEPFLFDGLADLGRNFLWSSGTGFFYKGYFPFIYAFNTDSWFYVFQGAPGVSDGYYIYDFALNQFGYTGKNYYPNYVVLPMTDPLQYVSWSLDQLDVEATLSLPQTDVTHAVAKAIRVTTTPPAIDGEMDPIWQDTPVYWIANHVGNTPSYYPQTNISGNWRALWDSNYLYLCLDVTDDTAVLALDNAFEIFASTEYGRVPNGGFGPSYGVNDAHLIWDLGADPITAKGRIYSVGSGEAFPALTAVKQTATGYVAEVALSWASLNQDSSAGVSWTPSSGTFNGGQSEYDQRHYIGFEIMLQDEDQGDGIADSKIAWCGGPANHSGDYAWADTSVWGTLELGYKNTVTGDSFFYDYGTSKNLGKGFQAISVDGFFRQAAIIYTGYFPMIFDFGTGHWYFIQADQNGDASDGYYLYDFALSQWGYTSPVYYPWYYILYPTDPKDTVVEWLRPLP